MQTSGIMPAITNLKFKTLLGATVFGLILVVLLLGRGSPKPEISPLRRPRTPDPATIVIDEEIQKKLDEAGLAPLKSHGATIFVSKNGSIRIPPDSVLERMEFRDLEELYHRYLYSIQEICQRSIHLGSLSDGGYELCQDAKLTPKKNCVVYSFGIRDDFSFDEEVSKLFECNVHSFDPANKMKDHRHSETIYFHSAGLDAADSTTDDGWKMRTLNSFKKELGHAQDGVDIIKIDIEAAEWIALPEILKSSGFKGVKQLIMEFHNFVDLPPWNIDHRYKDKYRHHLTVLRGLYDEGFRIFYYKRFNGACCLFKDEFNLERTGCNEVSLIRVKG